MNTPLRIALTGGIACGKSLLARFLNEQGIDTIDADDIVHELLPDPAERKRIAAEVFADPEKRRDLEARLHPQIKARILRALGDRPQIPGDSPQTLGDRPHVTGDRPLILGDRPRVTGDRPQKILDKKPIIAIIPLLYEVGWDQDFDLIACVTSKQETQIARMMSTRGYVRAEAEARLAAQWPVAEKAARADYVIANDGTAEDLRKSAEKFAIWLKNQVNLGSVPRNLGSVPKEI